MRESRQSSILSNSEKLKYPKCDRKKEHAKEVLNFICLTPNCKVRGLMCVLCKSSPDHSGHNVQPLKTFMTRLEESLKKMENSRTFKVEDIEPKANNQHALLQKLEENQLILLATLKVQVETVTDKIQEIEEKIVGQFNQARQKMSNEFEKESLIHRSLEEIQNYFNDEREKDINFDLKLSFQQLLSLLKIDKQEITIQNEAEAMLSNYMLSVNTFKTNLVIWERETMNILGDVFKIKPEYQVKEVKNRPTTAFDPTSKFPSPKFSPQFKAQSVVLEKDNKIAKLRDDKNGKICLLNDKIQEMKNQTVKFKIATLSAAASMQIGLCNRPNMAAKAFKFQKNALPNGTILYSSNGFFYSSAQNPLHSALHNTKTNFTFKAGDELILQIDQKQPKLLLKKKGEPKAQQLKVDFSQEEWKEVYFCVCINGVGDKLQVMG